MELHHERLYNAIANANPITPQIAISTLDELADKCHLYGNSKAEEVYRSLAEVIRTLHAQAKAAPRRKR